MDPVCEILDRKTLFCQTNLFLPLLEMSHLRDMAVSFFLFTLSYCCNKYLIKKADIENIFHYVISS